MSTQPLTKQALEKLPAADQAKLAQARATLQKATQHQPQSQAPTPANDNTAGGNAAMRQNAVGMSKAQPALSPTDQAHGRTALQGPAQGTEVKAAPTQAPATPSVPSRSAGISR